MAPGIIEKAKDKVIDAAEATKEGMQNVKDKVTGKQQERAQGETAYGTQGSTILHQQQATGYNDPVTGHGIGGTVFHHQQTTKYDDPVSGVGGTGLHQPGTYGQIYDNKSTLEKAKDKVLDTTKEGAQKIQHGAEKVKDKVLGSKEHDKCQERCAQECTFDSTRVRGFDGDNQGRGTTYEYQTQRTDMAPNL